MKNKAKDQAESRFKSDKAAEEAPVSRNGSNLEEEATVERGPEVEFFSDLYSPIGLGFWGTATSAAVGGDNDSLKAAFGINNISCVRQRQRKRLGHRLLSSCAFPFGWHLPLSNWTGSLFSKSFLLSPIGRTLLFSSRMKTSM